MRDVQFCDNLLALETLSESQGISRAWRNFSYKYLGMYELNEQKPSFDEEYSLYLEQKQQHKM
jgi:hypothetical protein